MGLRAAGRDEHRRRLHLERAPQVGSRRRAAHTAHSARCRLRDTGAMRRLERLPVRWRLAVTSAVLTFVILLLFAIIVGIFTSRQVKSSFDDDLRLTTVSLSERIHVYSHLSSLHYPVEGDPG